MTRILVAEDDRFLGTAYRAKLTKAGFEVQMATDGEEALAALENGFHPDLILLDLVMPRRDGFATLAGIRAQERFAKTPIIVASNLGQKEDLDKAKALGATDYVVKSDMSLDALIGKINSLLPEPGGGPA